MKTFLPLALALACACADRGLTDDPVRDDDPPVLRVSAPERGAIASGSGATVTVTGQVSDAASGVKGVAVNDRPATVQPDGKFAVTLPVQPGITLLRTVATDVAGNAATDTRAVLGGTLVPLDTPVEHAITAQISAGAFRFVGAVAAEAIDGLDLAAAVAAANPVVDVGVSCLKARVDVTKVQKGAADIELTPIAGGLDLWASVADVTVTVHVKYSALCDDGEADITVHADHFTAAGTLGLGIIDLTGAVSVDVSDTTASFDGFTIDQDLLPDDVASLLRGPLAAALAGAVAHELETQVPGVLADLFTNLAKADPFTIGGKTVHVGVWPKALAFTPDGGEIALDSNVYVDNIGGTGLVYLSNPRAAPTFAGDAEDGAFRVAVADDAANQLLASLWAAGIFDQSLPVGQGDAPAGLFDRVELKLALPPIVAALPAGGGVRVTAGDVLCTFLRGGEVVTKLAVSADAVLAGELTADNRLHLVSKSPSVWLDVLEDGVNGANPLAKGQVAELGSFVGTNLVTVIGDYLGKVPIPTLSAGKIAGAAITTGDADGGYVLVSGRLE
jgi:hypothetical protein